MTLLQHYTGFTNPTTLPLFLLTTCTFALFSTYHLTWTKPSIPGEGYWYAPTSPGGDTAMRWAVRVHLGCVVPAGIISPLQFLPVIRRKYRRFHRYSGRVIFLLLGIGNLTALKLGPKSVGGTISTQSSLLVVVFGSSVSIYKAWSSIRRGRVDVHRVWVIRTWAIVGGILSLRIMLYPLIIGILILSPSRYHIAKSCAEILFLYPEESTNSTVLSNLYSRYPLCSSGDSMDRLVVVTATMNRERPEEMAAMFNITFGVAFWLGLTINMAVCEWYLNVTRDEDERLRRVGGLGKGKVRGGERKRE